MMALPFKQIRTNIRQYLKEYFYLFENSWWSLAWLISLFLFTSLLELAGLGLIGPFVAAISDKNLIFDSQFTSYFPDSILSMEFEYITSFIGLGLVSVFFFKAIMSYVVQRAIIAFTYKHQLRLRNKLLAAYQNAPFEFHIKKSSSRIIQLIQVHTQFYTHHTLLASLKLISELVLFVFVTTFLALTNWVATLSIVSILLTVFLTYNFLLKKKITQLGVEVARSSEDITKNIQQSVRGLKEIKVLGCQNYFSERLNKSSELYARSSQSFEAMQILPRSIFEFTLVSFIAGFSIFTVYEASSSTTLPILSMFALAAVRLLPSSSQILSTTNNIRKSRVILKELYEDLKEIEKLKLDQKRINRDNTDFSTLELKNVDFHYQGSERLVLENISLAIHKGDSIGIVGSSGAGKTTLVNIILGLLHPSSGSIYLDGKSVDTKNGEWQKFMSYIPQDNYLIDESLLENIALGVSRNDIDMQRVKNAVEKAQLSELVSQLPNGLETRVGELGSWLSGGQRQRVALARSFYFNKKIIVMDEATSALDEDTERLVTESIQELKGKTTLLVITHKLSTIETCDKILQVENGKITEMNNLENLRKQTIKKEI